MKRDDLLDSIGGIDREMVEEGQRLRERSKAGKKQFAIAVPIAAAAILIAGLALAVLWNSRKNNTSAEGLKPGDPVETVSLNENADETGPELQTLTNEAEEAAQKALEAAEKESELQSIAAGNAVAEEEKNDSEGERQDRPVLGLEVQINIPEEIIDYIDNHTASIRTEIMSSRFADEKDADKALGDLVLMNPFVISREDGEPADTEHPSWYFPVMTNNRIACSVILTLANGEVLMGKTLNFNDDLNSLLGENKEHRVVMKKRTDPSREDNSAAHATGEGVSRPEFELVETGQTVSQSAVFRDLSIENTADESAFSILPDYDPYMDQFNTHVWYYDNAYAVFRIHHDEEERLVMMKNNGNGWETFCDIRSGKRTMSDRAPEIIAAFEDFYAHFVSACGPELTEETGQMISFLHTAAVPNRQSQNEDGGSLLYTDEELETIRNQVHFEYDPEMSERLLPSFLACYTAVDNGWLKIIIKPVPAVIRMECSDSEDAEIQELTDRYFGGRDKFGYYILSAFSQMETSEMYNCISVQNPEDFLDGNGFVGEWISGKL